MKLKTVAEGVRIFSYETSQFKTNKITIMMAMPLSSHVAANAVLPFILTRSCKDYPDFSKLNARLAQLYGASITADVLKAGDAQLLQIGISFIDDRFALDENERISSEAAELLLKMLFEPNFVDGNFTPEAVETEKRLLIETLNSELNNKRGYAIKRCTEIMCENELFSVNRLGTVEEIEALCKNCIYNAWKSVLSTAPVQINLIGNFDFEEIEKKVTEYFDGIDRDVDEIETEFINTVDEIKEVREEMDVNQSKLVIGMRTGMKNSDDDFPAYFVANAVYGGIPTSLLFTNVREKMSLCYYCSSMLRRGKGVMFVQSGVASENYELAKNEILKQLEDLQNGNFSDDVLDAAKKSMCDSLGGVYDHPDSINSWYITQILNKKLLKAEDLCRKVEKVTREDVIRVAGNIIPDTIFLLDGKDEANGNK